MLLTALDFQLASLARKLGTVTAIYDPLTWYWRTVPEIIATCDLYIAQQFLGVAERMEHNSRQFAQARMVSPIVEQQARVQPDSILINLGGLQNPFWSVDDATQYAAMMLRAIVPQLPKATPLVIATSSAVARQIPEWPARSYSHSEIGSILKKTRYAFMTPGLGNIYTAAAYDLPTVWLPPANDSQGQQLELLVQHGCVDGTVDWKDVLDTASIEYAHEQSSVLAQITESVQQLHTQQQLQQRLSEHIAQEATRVASFHSSNLTQLLTKFGHGGASQVAALTHQLAEGALKTNINLE
ncbi:hypothetical protein KBC79_00115 [Candidatus Woesebacteria bacterium]|nr:hypothetical protein [Candidatus Woesebacteria bacterium]